MIHQPIPDCFKHCRLISIDIVGAVQYDNRNRMRRGEQQQDCEVRQQGWVHPLVQRRPLIHVPCAQGSSYQG